MAESILYLTELVGLKVFDLKGRRIGRIKDAALVPLIDPVRVDRYLVGGGWAWLTIRHDQVRSISLDGLYLRDELLTPYHDDEYMLRLVRDLLDQQIIDVQGRKVVRVTDVTLLISQEAGHDVLRIWEVDIGLRSMLRRLLQGVLPPRWIRRIQAPIAPRSIPWQFCNIVEPDPQRRLRLNISHELLAQMHPADLADIVEELSPEDREAIFETLDSEVAAEALSEVQPEIQAQILESLEAEKAAEIIEEMAPDEAADVLAELEEETSEEILEEMEAEPKSEVQELLEFPDDTAGGLMTTEYVAVPEQGAVADALTALKGNEELLESLNALFLIDAEGRLSGVVPLARLFIASPQTPLRAIAVAPAAQVSVRERQDRVTELFDKYNLLTLPVLDEEGRLAGVITADDVISILRKR
ncbi:MAG: CBS domain-containing protein [Bryobacterales bacterium]|nr:CBS domain-containing protein [Bryobacteraceae bacterium]MDW8354762.1 CBS domain-containing protein [Bryobacterales bacterium]